MNKQEQLKNIMDAIEKYHAGNEKTIATLFISANTQTQMAITECKGSGIVLAQAFGSQMQASETFNRLMKSLIGAYLSQHPEEKKEFIRGLEIISVNPNIN
jgi:hypothetical protein